MAAPPAAGLLGPAPDDLDRDIAAHLANVGIVAGAFDGGFLATFDAIRRLVDASELDPVDANTFRMQLAGREGVWLRLRRHAGFVGTRVMLPVDQPAATKVALYLLLARRA